MPKFSLAKLLRRYWAILGVLCVVIGASVCFGIELKTTPSARETFSMFLDLPYGSIASSALESRIKEKDHAIKLATAYCFDPSSDEYSTYYSTWGRSADLLLFSSDYLKERDFGEFASVDSLMESDCYAVNGVSYGLKAEVKINEYFTVSNGAYYCFFRKTSVHIGNLSEDCQSDLAIELAKEFFGAL
jgi:hypothetical protein